MSAILVVLLSSCEPPQAESVEPLSDEQPTRPNIVLIMADDMGWGDTGYNGNPIAQTPNLDEMANAGLVFDRFYSGAPVCSPTRGSVLTGRHPFRYGVYYANVGHLPVEEITLAELLKDAGYATGFFGKWHLGIMTTTEPDANRGGKPEFADEFSPPWMHGFDTVFASESKVPTFDPMIKPKKGYQETWWNPVAEAGAADAYGTHYWDETGTKVVTNLEGDDTRVIVDRAIPFIEEAADSGAPFFAVIWTHTPHLPVVASDEDSSAIDTDDPYTAAYYGSIRAMDQQIGRVRATLDQVGIADNTLIWFKSDNGPEHYHPPAPGSTKGLRDTKRSLYEGGIRVPGILEWPEQIAAGVTLGAPAVTSDILPTILDYLDLDYPTGAALDGVSLKPVLSGERSERDSPIGFESAYQIAYIGDRYKLVHQPPGNSMGSTTAEQLAILQERKTGQNPDSSPVFELYDLVVDPYEGTDISADQPEVLDKMTKELSVWRESVAKSIKAYEH